MNIHSVKKHFCLLVAGVALFDFGEVKLKLLIGGVGIVACRASAGLDRRMNIGLSKAFTLMAAMA
jgi:hypothetical protein